MFKRTHYYHVVFHFIDKGNHGIGSIAIITKAKMESEKTLKSVTNHIEEVLGGKNVVILNWKRIKGRMQL